MSDVREAAQQTWPPFVLIAGLLMVGAVAHAAGLFERCGALLSRLPGSPGVILAGCLALVAAVTATMNLDTAVVFLTPVLVLVARARGLDERPFLYGALFMANGSSLFLPGANLTNLLVLGGSHASGAHFAQALFAPALTASVVTGLGVWLMFGRGRRGPGFRRVAAPSTADHAGGAAGAQGAKVAPAISGVVVAAALTVGISNPAIPVLIGGLAVSAVACVQRLITPRAVLKAVGPAVLVGLFAVSVMLGVLARTWDGPSSLLADAGRWETVGIATLAAVCLNNLPAAVLLSADHVEHARALLIGLNLGPNLAVTGSLSSYLWFRTARQAGAEPSLRAVSQAGIVIAPVTIALATLALALSPGL